MIGTETAPANPAGASHTMNTLLRQKISGEIGRIPTKDLRASEPFNAFFFVPAVSGGQGAQDQGGGGFSFGGLFRTHPTLERRLAQLDELERQLGHAN